MAYKLSDIILGKHDGKKEALFVPNFEDYFFDYNNLYETSISPEIFLILGKKGTGKTLLAYLIQRKKESDPTSFYKLDSYKTFSLTELQHLKNGEITTEEYVPIWKWIILIELSKLVITNEALIDNRDVSTLKEFLELNGFGENIESFRTINITIDNDKGANWKWFSLKTAKKSETTRTSYLELIEPLKDLLVKILKNYDHTYTVMFDELDDKFQDTDNYKNTIIGLLKVTDELNMKFLENNINFKVLVFLRKDIFKLLHYSDLNKMVEDSALVLDWGDVDRMDSPVLQILTNKAKNSIPEFRELSHREILEQLFSKNRIRVSRDKKVTLYTYILQRTFLRPRDIINYFEKIIKRYGNRSIITPEIVIEVEKNYSEYFKNEIRDELIGHILPIEINGIFKLLKNFGQIQFDFRELEKYYQRHPRDYPELNLENIIKKLYSTGAVGTFSYNPRYKKNYYRWSYKEDDDFMNLDHKICIHNGLRKNLNLN